MRTFFGVSLVAVLAVISQAYAFGPGSGLDGGGAGPFTSGGLAKKSVSMGGHDLTFDPATGAQCIYDELGATCGTRTDDANGNNRHFNASDVWPFAAVAKVPGNTIVRSGLDSKTFNVLSGLAGCTAADTVTVVRAINGTSVSNTLTYGTDFCSGVGVDTCANATEAAARLAVAVDALSGVGSTASGATCPSGAVDARCVGVTADRLTGGVYLTNNDDTCTVDSNGTDATVVLGGDAYPSTMCLGGPSTTTGFCISATSMNTTALTNAGGAAPAIYMVGSAGVTLYGPVTGAVISGSGGNYQINPNGLTKQQNGVFSGVQTSCTFPGAGGAATCTTAQSIPLGAVVLQVSGRQTVANTTCTTCTAGIDMGPGADADQLGTALECDVYATKFTTATATADVVGTCLKAGGCDITMTAVGGNCVSGTTAWSVFYMTATGANID